MKKRVLLFFLACSMVISLVACDSADNMAQDMQNGMNNMKDDIENSMENMGNTMNAAVNKYNENGIEFDIPESWQKNFSAQYSENSAQAADGYSTINFYYTADPNLIKIMTVGRFKKTTWEGLTEQDTTAVEKKIGQSKDGEWIYTLNFEDSNLSQDEGYMSARKDAEMLKDKIKITK